jgi:hypothetical protein
MFQRGRKVKEGRRWLRNLRVATLAYALRRNGITTATHEEVKGYLEQDPFVKAGRLKYTISPWWGSVGTLLP